ncbi:MAG: lysophospholipid acyltransferase family protein [Clostridia bacterium]|nr:lysophospholipid acyltransferase family protein [Clostridia bacterium]MDQ7791763.1 lysophospholipid acyltransferase family protein [Clostridia bacterium]
MFYSFARLLCRIFLLTVRRWKVYGLDNLPAAGGIVVAANHTSYLDPIAVGCAMRRRVSFMGKAELFRIPVLKSIVVGLGTFPVRRGGVDREAIRTALRYLAEGKAIGIFPEGTRSKDGKIHKPQQGAALLALKADVPIVPVALKGTCGAFRKVKVAFGEPLSFPEYRGVRPSREVLEAISDRIMVEIDSMMQRMR